MDDSKRGLLDQHMVCRHVKTDGTHCLLPAIRIDGRWWHSNQGHAAHRRLCAARTEADA